MKNKNFTRFLCFFMCFCLCFAWFGPSIEAQAVAVELGWVTYMIISVMAAMGITATISGGIDALKNAVEDGFDEWAGDQKQAKIIQISDYISYYEPPNGDGLDPDDVVKKLLIGAGAFTVIKDFIVWFRDNILTEDVSNTFVISAIQVPADVATVTYNGVTEMLYLCENKDGTPFSMSWSSSSTVLSVYKIGSLVPYGVDLNFNVGDLFSNSGYHVSSMKYIVKDDGLYVYGYRPSGDLSGWFCLSDVAANRGFSLSDIVGVSFFYDWGSSYSETQCYICPCFVLNDGRAYFVKGFNIASSGSEGRGSLYSLLDSSVTITAPSEITDISIGDDQQLELGFRGISGSFASPEEFSEAVKSNIVVYGVLPDVDPTVTEVTEPAPTPVPTPDVESDGSIEGNVSGILEWIKAIFNAILSLPQAIANLILEGIKAIFVPDPEVIEAEFMDLLEEINDKYLFDFDLDSLFGASKEPDDISAVYAVGNHSWSVTFVSWYYLKKAVEFFRPYIRGFIVLMLIFYNLRQFMGIFGLGGVMNGDSADRRVNDLAV